MASQHNTYNLRSMAASNTLNQSLDDLKADSQQHSDHVFPHGSRESSDYLTAGQRHITPPGYESDVSTEEMQLLTEDQSVIISRGPTGFTFTPQSNKPSDFTLPTQMQSRPIMTTQLQYSPLSGQTQKMQSPNQSVPAHETQNNDQLIKLQNMGRHQDQLGRDITILRQDMIADSVSLRTELTEKQTQISEDISNLKSGIQNILKAINKPQSVPPVQAVDTLTDYVESAQVSSSVGHHFAASAPQRSLFAENRGEDRRDVDRNTIPKVIERSTSQGQTCHVPQVDHQRRGVNSQQSVRPRMPIRRQDDFHHLSDSELSDQVSDGMLSTSTRHNSRLGQRRFSYNTKLPPFTGTESWEVYYNRFNDVAVQEGWTTNDKLRELLPKLQGQAGEFVYGQLSGNTRRNFRLLVDEIEHRFRKIESARSYSSKYTKRTQKPGESAEDYAAELKRLYHKAYPNRDPATRREDLLRRFLDGAFDQNSSFQVEYVKQPGDIDEAVFELVSYQDSKKQAADSQARAQKSTRYLTSVTETDDQHCDEYSDAYDDVRAVSYNKPNPQNSRPPTVCTNSGKVPISVGNQNESLKQEIIAEIGKLLETRGIFNSPPVTSSLVQINKSVTCFNCKQLGHYAKDCPQRSQTTPKTHFNRPNTYRSPQGLAPTVSAKVVSTESDIPSN